jgi:hypothetical protein
MFAKGGDIWNMLLSRLDVLGEKLCFFGKRNIYQVINQSSTFRVRFFIYDY